MVSKAAYLEESQVCICHITRRLGRCQVARPFFGKNKIRSCCQNLALWFGRWTRKCPAAKKKKPSRARPGWARHEHSYQPRRIFSAQTGLAAVTLPKLLTHFVCTRDAIKQLTPDHAFLFRSQQLREFHPFRNRRFAFAGGGGLRFVAQIE